jgi:WD40 repeat protein
MITIVTVEQGKINLWDTRTGKVKKEIAVHGFPQIAINPNGALLAIGTGSTIEIRSALTGSTLRTISQKSQRMEFVNLDELAVQNGSTISLWNMRTGKQIGKLLNTQHLTDVITDWCPSYDGKSLITLALSSDQKDLLTMWDVERMRSKLVSERPALDAVHNFAISPLSDLIACTTRQSLELWDARSSKKLRVIPTELGMLKPVAFSRDGETLASASGKSVKLWRIGDLRNVAKIARPTTSIEAPAE